MFKDNENLVKYYDAAYSAKADLIDIPFYVELATEFGGPVLELGCGSGRVLINIARLGIAIDGLDFNEQLLKILSDKIANEPDLQGLVTIHHGDMRSFDLQKEYKLITIPFRPMQNLYTVEDQERALKCARKHLKKDGLLAFDVFYPDFNLLEQNCGAEKLELEWEDPDAPSLTLKRYFVRHHVDKIHQYYDGEYIFRRYDGETIVSEERAPIRMGYYTYPHLQVLFNCCGLEVVEEYGSFTKEPMDACKDMIFILRRRD